MYVSHIRIMGMVHTYWPIGLVGSFTNGPGDQGSIPDRVISKTQKMVLDVALLDTPNYKVRIKGKVEQCYIIKVMIFYIDQFSVIIFYYLVG